MTAASGGEAADDSADLYSAYSVELTEPGPVLDGSDGSGSGTDTGTGTGTDSGSGSGDGGGVIVDDDGQSWCPTPDEGVSPTNDHKKKKKTKVLVCHYPPGNPANRHTIAIAAPAVKAHINNHHDTLGPCPAPDNDEIYQECPAQ